MKRFTDNRNLRGIAAMLVAVFMFALMDTGLKLLTAHYPSMQVAALRAMASLPLVCAYVAWRGAFGTVWRVRWSLHLLRGVLGIGMLAAFAYGLRELPLANAYSIFFVSPMLITILSVPLLKERVDGARWLAIGVGMAGVLVVLRPTGAGLMTVGALAVLGSAVFYALSSVLVRIIGRTDSSESMVLWLMVMVAAGAGALAAPAWVPVRIADGGILVGIAITGFLGPPRPVRAGPGRRRRWNTARWPGESAWTGCCGRCCRTDSPCSARASSSPAESTWCGARRCMASASTPDLSTRWPRLR